MILRETTPADGPALPALYREAFPDEDLAGLVVALLDDPAANPLSLVADDAGLIGHALFTTATIDMADTQAALLGPVAVDPARQRSGIGSALVRAGLDQLRAAGIDVVFVLGDPAWYGRFGFAAETAVRPPYPLPPEWADGWQSRALSPGPHPGGTLRPAAAWDVAALWAP